MQDHISEARLFFSEPGKWPLICDSRMKARYWERPGELEEFWIDLAYGAPRPTIPAHNPFDVVERFVVLNRIYCALSDSPDHAEEYFNIRGCSIMGPLLQEAIELRPVEAITEREDLEWEIANAAAGRCWERAKRLCLKLAALDERPNPRTAELWAFVAFDAASIGGWKFDPMNLASTVPLDGTNPRGYLRHRLADHSEAVADTDEVGGDVADDPAWVYLQWLRTFRALKPAEIADDSQYQRIVHALAAIENLEAVALLDPSMWACLGWCQRALGLYKGEMERIGLAGECYEKSVLGERERLPNRAHPDLCRAAISCYHTAKRWPDAVRVAELLQRDNPDDPAGLEELARIADTRGEYEQAIVHLQKAVEVAKSKDPDWRTQLLLKVGTFHFKQTHSRQILRDALERNPKLRATVGATIARSWRLYTRLSDAARSEWLNATLLLCDQGLEEAFGEERFMEAVRCFAAAAERQLRDSVFEQIATVGGVNDELERYRGQHPLTLGTMCRLLVSGTRSEPGLRGFEGWLSKNKPQLWRYCRQSRQLLARLPLLRNSAVHDGNAARSECDEMEQITRDLLAACVG